MKKDKKRKSESGSGESSDPQSQVSDNVSQIRAVSIVHHSVRIS